MSCCLAINVLFAHPGSFVRSHGPGGDGGFGSGDRASLRSVLNHVTIQYRGDTIDVMAKCARRRKLFEGYTCCSSPFGNRCEVYATEYSRTTHPTGEISSGAMRQAQHRAALSTDQVRERAANAKKFQLRIRDQYSIQQDAIDNHRPLCSTASHARHPKNYFAARSDTTETMSAEKRPADEPAGQLVVKRQNLGERALTRANASGSSALIQSVCA